MMKKFGSFFGAVLFFISAQCFAEGFKTGAWRFELRNSNANVPFVIELTQHKKNLIGKLYNGKEIISLKGLTLKDKHLSIPLQTYEVTLELELETPTVLKGYLIRHNKNPEVKTPVIGVFGEKNRFNATMVEASSNFNGRWAVTLKDEQGTESPGIVVFEQNKNLISGSILTTTGDYRYFEGYISGDDFETASFDGVFNYIFRGRIKKDVLEGSILSNTVTKLQGKNDPKAELPDAYKQTQVESLDFAFPDLQGRMTSLKTPRLKGKAVIIQLFGSWCPNCIDEMNFLIPWYKANKHRQVEILALAFERSVDFVEAKKQLVKVKKMRRVPYTILHAGSTSEEKPMDKIKGLKNFISFPTTIFLNKKHQVVKVHAGFTGPSTGVFYEEWKKEFNEIVDEITK